MRNALLALLFLVAAPPLVASGLQPKSVYVFKNGVAFVVEEGTPPAKERIVEIDAPDALFGTVWVRAGGRAGAIAEVVAHRTNVPDPRPVGSLGDLLAANAGKSVTVTIGDREITGKVLASPAPAAVAAGESSFAPGTRSPLLFMEIAGEVKAFEVSSVRAVAFREVPATSLPDEVTANRLSIHLRDAATAAPVTLSYLRRDLGWAPEYELRLVDDTSAQLTMQAVLVNDALELRATDVYFVVGVPSFRFDRVRSPLSLRETLAQFLGSLDRRGDDSMAMSNLMSQSATFNVSSDSGLGPTTAGLAGSSEEDLFLYRQPGVDLMKGERGVYNVLTSTVPLRHLYRWDVPDSAPVDGTAANVRESDLAQERVWHCVRLTNTTQFPWTTGSALVISDGKPIAGSVVEYTAKSGSVEVRLTAATDIAADRDEVEVSRQAGARVFSRSTYDAVTVEGTLRMRNFKDKPVTVSITKLLTGEVVEKSEAGKSVALATGRGAVNPNSKIEWEIPLRPGEEKTVTYRYRIYVRG